MDTPNHKLRSLVSLSLRNISLNAPAAHRPRTKTIDDEALPTTLKSPAKLVALREQKHRTLEHSRSSQNLKPVHEDAVVDDLPIGEHEGNGRPKTPQRPALGKMRRRSTLEWANATPQRRQEKLENVTAERMGDVFFSLHVGGVEEPVYVSEVVEKTMNPTFRHIDWSACGPGITRSSSTIIRIWVRSAKFGDERWRQLMEMRVDLTALQYLGKSVREPVKDNIRIWLTTKQLEHNETSLPPNAVIFHMPNGVYTAFSSLSNYKPAAATTKAPPTRRTGSTNHARLLPTSSFDALLRLAKLDDSIQDALATRNQIAAELETLIGMHQTALEDRDRVPEAEDRLKTIEYAKKTVQKQVEKGRRQTEEKREALISRRSLMKADLERREVQAKGMGPAKAGNLHVRDDLVTRKRAFTAQRRRVCEDLSMIYPITPLPTKSLTFTIRGLTLPDSQDLDAEPPEKVAAALGHVAHVLQMLSFYLRQSLPYPVIPRSSTSMIEDPISLLKTTASTTQKYGDERALRTYPLYSKGVPRFRFEYGVFLLNKDIQILLEGAYGLRVVDIRQTLPNLKYLLYVATAGEGELPARKAGGVRGLLRGATPDLRRVGSEESTGSALSGLLFSEGKPAGKARDAVESLKRTVGKASG
ncbi:hypothetical protein LTR42_012144 [Elasticomyces elasticus]|nr:hypothetical protein LTR42_012144 [Elasticomyces elasticus]